MAFSNYYRRIHIKTVEQTKHMIYGPVTPNIKSYTYILFFSHLKIFGVIIF